MSRKGLFTMAGVCLALSFNAFAIEVGSIADSRFPASGGWTLDGDEMTDTRAKLLEPSNFGEGGTVPEAINITDVAGTISFAALSTFDVFFIGYLANGEGNAFSMDELEAMQDWVSAGGTMVITCDEPGFDAVCAAFGPTPANASASPPVSPTVAGATRPPFNGPFGNPTELAMAGSRQYFGDTGGFMVLAEDQSGNPVVLEALIGQGRVVVFTDVDMIGNDTLSEGSGIANDNDRFLGNLFAYLAAEAGETFFLNPGLNGNWWAGPSRSGEGAQFEVVYPSGQVLVVLTFYSYDAEGNQIFLIAVGPVDDNTAELDVFITSGPVWGSDFDPGDVVEEQWGTGEVSATHCNAMHIMLTPNPDYVGQGFEALEYDLVRLNPPAGPCPLPNPLPLL